MWQIREQTGEASVDLDENKSHYIFSLDYRKNDRFDEMNFNSYTFRVMKVQMNKMDQTCTVVELTADSGAMLEAAIFLKLKIFCLFFKPGYKILILFFVSH